MSLKDNPKVQFTIAMIKYAVAEKQATIGVVVGGGQADLNLKPFAETKTAIVISPNVGELKLQQDAKTGAVRVINQTGKVVPYLVAIVDRSKVPNGVTGLVIPPFGELAKIVGSKINFNLGAWLGGS